MKINNMFRNSSESSKSSESSSISTSDEEIRTKKNHEIVPPSLKKICLKYLQNNFDLVWKNKEKYKSHLPILSLDIIDSESNSILQAIADIEKIKQQKKEKRKETISEIQKELGHNKCFIKTFGSTVGIFGTLGITGMGYGLAKAFNASASTILTMFSVSPAILCFGTACSMIVLTPIAAQGCATCIVNWQGRNPDELKQDEIKMLPPNIKVMRP